MFNRVRGLFGRYADRHLSVRGPGKALPKADGVLLGYVDNAIVHGNRIRFDGWTIADQLVLSWQGGQVVQRPHLHRPDVAQSIGSEEDVGFAIEAPLSLGPFTLTLRCGNAEYDCPVGVPSRIRMIPARLWLKARFLGSLAMATPSVARWLITGDPVYRARVKTRLNLDAIPVAGPMQSSLFDVDDDTQPLQGMGSRITIVLPVYNAFDLLPDVLARVETHTDLDWRLVVIEDKSPDPRVRPFLRDWAGNRPDTVHLIENDENLGFIQSVNKGLRMALEWGDHVVLLNSDALVPAAWASRLLAPLYCHENVATVTPMSNDAEIFSVPAICTRTCLLPGEADAIDAVARRFHPEAVLSEAPTGVGFCMAMNIAFLRDLPSLDTVFGRGYGEEVDWCQKARARDGRHLGLHNLFVEHKGGESFGSDEKKALVLKNNSLIASRYPTYDREVQEFIQADPMIAARVALAIAFVAARASDRVPVYLAHSLGGGAETYLQNRIATELKHGQSALVLRVGGPQRFQIEVRTPDGESTGTTDDFDLVDRLLSLLPSKRIVYSCGVGDRDPIELPAFLRKLARPDAGDEIDVLIHDFFPISPSYCLLDSDGQYRGPVRADRSDRAHTVRRADKSRVSLSDWQAEWGRLLEDARRITVFSENSRAHVRASYPGLDAKIAVTPHSLPEPVPSLIRPVKGPVVIGVLGNIGLQKGAAVVQQLARIAESRKDFKIALIGNIDPAFGLPRTTPVHGNYHISDLAALVERYGITCWLIPSVWPETFSYTTHECLETGLPVYAFALGAQGDAVRNARNGFTIDFAADMDLTQNVLKTILS